VSWHLQNQVDQNALEGFYRSIYETAVMRTLASFADDDGSRCFPSLETLAKRSQCSQRTVKRVLKKFRERRWITVKATGRWNHYRILPHGWVVPATALSRTRTGARLRATESPQKGQAGPSEGTQSPVRGDTETHDSYQLLSSKNPHHIYSLSLRRERVRERENICSPIGGFEEVTEEEVTKEEEPQSFVTQSEDTTRRPGRVPPAARGAASQANATAQCCACDSEHPPGMPSLDEIVSEMRKLRVPSDEYDPRDEEIWLTKEAEELHDVWLACGFRMKNGPIRDWKASLRNWHRWRENGGADVFG
jgi:hypothetical protein